MSFCLPSAHDMVTKTGTWSLWQKEKQKIVDLQLCLCSDLVPIWCPFGAKFPLYFFFFQEESSLCATAALPTQPTCGTYGQPRDWLLSSDATSVQKVVLTQPEVFGFVKNIINIKTAIIIGIKSSSLLSQIDLTETKTTRKGLGSLKSSLRSSLEKKIQHNFITTVSWKVQ